MTANDQKQWNTAYRLSIRNDNENYTVVAIVSFNDNMIILDLFIKAMCSIHKLVFFSHRKFIDTQYGKFVLIIPTEATFIRLDKLN